jgi:hypothetical protein
MKSPGVSVVAPAVTVLAVTALTSCTAAGDGPTFPTAALSRVEPFIVGSPAVFTAGPPPDVVGTWIGSILLTACRSVDGLACKADSASSRAVRLDVAQAGTLVTGTFSMHEPDGPRWPFGGYVTAAGGIAGQVNADAGARIVLRLAPVESGFTGEIADETWSAGALSTTRHFSVAAPLTRIGR